MSDINFCNTKEQLNHLGEVVTGKVNGSPTGADIDTSTLPYTGQVRKTLPALEEEYQADIDNFVQVSDQLIIDKTAEFDTSIANKEAEADAAIDAYRLLNKGSYAPGITLESNFEYITYNGESYFANNPPYTTTATTPDSDGNLFAGGYTTLETVASKIGNKNELSNSNFLFKSPDNITHPNATPESYVAGTQIFSGVYAGNSGCTVTFIDGRVNCTAGDYQFKTPNNGGLERIPVFKSSVSDYDGIPKTIGVSHSLVGEDYVTTVTPAAGDVFSVKLEQGGVATRHEAGSSTRELKSYVDLHDSLSGAKSRTDLTVNDSNPVRIYIYERKAFFKVVSGETPNEFNILAAANGLQLKLVNESGAVHLDSLGAVPDDGVTPNADVFEFFNNNYELGYIGSGYYRIERQFGFNKKIVGNGKRESYIVVDNDIDGAMIYPTGQGVTSARLEGLSVISAQYKTNGGRDASGVAMWLHSRPVLIEVEFFGFGGAGVKVPGVSESTPITYGLLLGRFVHCNFQFCGVGAEFIHTASAPDFSTTTRFEDCYIASCDVGIDAVNLKSSVFDEVVFEFCNVGANLQSCSGQVQKWYFESNTTPYEINGGAITILDELLAASNANPPIVKRNASNQPNPAFTQVSPLAVKSQSFGILYDDGNTPITEREQKETVLKIDPSPETLPLKLSSYPTKTLGELDATIPVSHSATGVSKVIKLHIGADGTVRKTDPLIKSMSRITTGVYNVEFKRSMTPSDIKATTVEQYSSANVGSKAAIMMVEGVAPNNNWTRFITTGSITGFRVNVSSNALHTLEDQELMISVWADIS